MDKFFHISTGKSFGIIKISKLSKLRGTKLKIYKCDHAKIQNFAWPKITINKAKRYLQTMKKFCNIHYRQRPNIPNI